MMVNRKDLEPVINQHGPHIRLERYLSYAVFVAFVGGVIGAIVLGDARVLLLGASVSILAGVAFARVPQADGRSMIRSIINPR